MTIGRAKFGTDPLLLVTLLLIGCGRPAGVIFEPLSQPIVWPTPPDVTRVRYVGQLVTSADLKPAVSFGEAIGEMIFGKKSTKSMLTPYGVCTDGKDRLFVADSNAQVVHMFDLKTRVHQQWKPPENASAFSQPIGLAWDPAGKLFVSDSVGGRIRVFDSTGKLLAEIGSQHVSRPCGLAFDNASRRLFVADTGLHQVIVLTDSGQLVAQIGTRGTDLGKFNYPTHVAIDSGGSLFVSDSLNFRIQQFAPDFKPLRQIGAKGDVPGYFGQPKGVALDSQDHLYVVDANFEAVQVFNADGQLLMDFGQEGNGPGEFWIPAGIFIDPGNRIWIADSYNRRVQVFDFVPEVTP
jgi:sugar lactone lactonase YvrE